MMARGRACLTAASSLVAATVVTVGRSARRRQVVMVSPREVFFDSSGVRCAADLYLPDHVSLPVPCVVMGHGGSGIKRLGLPAYAEKFARGGIAALVFDYRRFGASDGEPRQAIDVDAQRDDYRAAIRYVRGLPGIDEAHIAIWGTFTARTVQFTVAALRDRRRARRGEPPYLVPVVAPPGQVAVFTEPDAAATFDAMGGEACGWRNELAPRFIFNLPKYAPGTCRPPARSPPGSPRGRRTPTSGTTHWVTSTSTSGMLSRRSATGSLRSCAPT